MRRTPVRLAHAVALTTLVGIGAGCGGGPTAPKTQSAQQMAAHFDSLYVAAILAGTHGDSLRSLVITYLEIATAVGATPVPVTVTTGSGPQKWQALSFQLADTSGDSLATTLTTTIAYSDDNVTNAVFAEVTTGYNPHNYAEMVAADTVYASTTNATALETVTNGGACRSPSGYSNPTFAAVDTLYHCNLATFQSSLKATFPSTPGIDPSLLQISFSSLTSNGERLANAKP
jgi:hypothetical protein